MKKIPCLFVAIALIITALSVRSFAQFNVVSNLPAAQVAGALGGPGVTISNAFYGGGTLPTQVGVFTNVNSNVPFPAGVFLCTGIATDFNNVPFNLQPGFTSFPGPGTPGDAMLNQLAFPSTTNDAAILEFDFVAVTDSIFFDYVFASEEYNEYACSDFNDVFAFYISGPGFGGPTNIALIPGTSLPVAINNVNSGVPGMFGDFINCTPPNGSLAFSNLFIDNTNGAHIEYDGMTVALTAKAQVIPCSTYHIKLAVADAFDSAFESGVFLRAGSFSSGILNIQALTANGDSTLTEGCNTGQLTFTLGTATPNNYNIPVTIGGTATNGVDFNLLTAAQFVIPAGDSSVTVVIDPIADGIPEGIETLFIIVQTSACSFDTVVFYINEEIILPAPTVFNCNTVNSTTINYAWNAVAGATGYEVSLDGGLTWIPANPGPLQHTVNGVVPGTPVEVLVRAIGGTPGCNDNLSASAICNTCAIQVQADAVNDLLCAGDANGSVTVSALTGTAPYTFNWSNGSNTTSANPTASLTGLSGGVYSVTVVEAGGCAGIVSVTVTEPSILVLSASATDTDCPGDATGTASVSANGGTPGYAYLWSNGNQNATATGLTVGAYTVTVTDANGCSSTASASVSSPTFTVSLAVSGAPIDCDNVPDASIQSSISGGTGNMSYLWSNGATTADISNLPAGNYSLTVTDANGCTISESATVTTVQLAVADAFITSAGITNATIAQSTSANVGLSNPAAGYTYQWTVEPAGGADFANATAAATSVTGTAVGEYVLVIVVTSVDGCTASDTLYLTVHPGFLGMPSAFTPNGDGENDRFRPVGLEAEFIKEFAIFNRFGQKVYDSPALVGNGWDGTLGGQPQARDVYLFVLTYQLPTDLAPTTLRGEVMLVR